MNGTLGSSPLELCWRMVFGTFTYGRPEPFSLVSISFRSLQDRKMKSSIRIQTPILANKCKILLCISSTTITRNYYHHSAVSLSSASYYTSNNTVTRRNGNLITVSFCILGQMYRTDVLWNQLHTLAFV
jgi:hypothetical protein